VLFSLGFEFKAPRPTQLKAWIDLKISSQAIMIQGDPLKPQGCGEEKETQQT